MRAKFPAILALAIVCAMVPAIRTGWPTLVSLHSPRLAFLDVHENAETISIVDNPGTAPTRLTGGELEEILDFAFSTDGQVLALETAPGSRSSLKVYTVRSGKLTAEIDVLGCESDICSAPSWDWNHQHLSYQRRPRHFEDQISTWSISFPYGTPEALLGDPHNGLRAAVWSPVENKLAAFDAERGQIIVIDFDSNTRTVIPSKSGESLSWSADGKKLACVILNFASEIGLYQLAVANFETGIVAPITDPSPNDPGSVVWGPSGNIAFSQLGSGSNEGETGRQIWLANEIAHTVRQVTHATGFTFGGLVWSNSPGQILAVRNKLGGIPSPPSIWSIEITSGSSQLVAEMATLPAIVPR